MLWPCHATPSLFSLSTYDCGVEVRLIIAARPLCINTKSCQPPSFGQFVASFSLQSINQHVKPLCYRFREQ